MKHLIISLLLFVNSIGLAQEQMVPLSLNPTLINVGSPRSPFPKTLSKGFVPAVKLPFIDDFSRAGLYPQQQLWADRYVFINKSYSVNPPSFGVATFDAMMKADEALGKGDEKGHAFWMRVYKIATKLSSG